jgi:hypothetical protein
VRSTAYRSASAVGLLAGLASCGSIDLGAAIECGPADECPRDTRCGADRLCHAGPVHDGGPADATVEPDATPELWFEGEGFDRTTDLDPAVDNEWIVDTSVLGYRGTGFAYASPDLGTVCVAMPPLDCGVRMDFDLQATQPGDYYVHVRSYVADFKEDSIHVGLDGVYAAWFDTVEGAGWHWTSTPTPAITLDTQPHVLNVWLREDGFRLDVIYLSTDGTPPP